MKNYKVLFISTKAITQNTFFDSFIKKTNFDLTLGCSDVLNLRFKKKKLQFNFANNIFYLLNPIKFFLELFSIRKKINNQFDLIIINNPLAGFYIRLALILSNQKIMYFVHGYRFHSAEKNFKSFLFYHIEKFLSKNTNYFININREDYSVTNRFFKKKKNKILKLPSVGVDLKKLNKYKYKSKNKKFRIGVIAAYRDNKGYIELIKISEFLQKYKLNAEIICYGYDNPSKYQKIINQKKLKNIFLNSFKKNIYEEFKKFDILCHLSKREGLPISILESLCLGVPVICFDIRGNKDLIKNNFNGFLIKPYDIPSFQNKIYKLLIKKIDIRTIKKNIRNSVYSKHGKNNINKELNKFIIHACKN